MSLLTVIIVIIVVGLLLWLVNRYIPMQSTVKSILNGLVIIILVIWLLKIAGALSYLSNVKI